MVATSETNFLVPGYGNSYINFKRSDDGKVSHFECRGMTCPKMEEQEPVNLETYTGRYQSDELNTFYTLIIEDGSLVAQHRNHGNISITPLWNEEFLGDRFFIRSLQFDRDKNGIKGF